ncbi:type II toxin-antitoxin system RelE/ParE family toxin [Thermodesulfobacteriota bacterium]
MEGQKDLFRLRVSNYRIIYSILDRFEAVIIVTVRPRRKDTYKNIPLEDLSAKTRELEGVAGSKGKRR